jgi:putative membrane protein insertion efficiency factor
MIAPTVESPGPAGATGPARAVAAIFGAYKRYFSPLLPPACRFSPTCSEYAREAVTRHGLGRGLWLAARRLARCHPFHAGGADPVP